jgi:plasmid stabilization system protein ParE
MKLVWTNSALEDRRTIYDYIDAENPRAAAELDELFKQAADRLCIYPKMGRPGRVPGTRELSRTRIIFWSMK